MSTQETETPRRISGTRLITQAAGIATTGSFTIWALQDIGMNPARVGSDALGITAGALVTGVGAIMIVKDRRNFRRTQS